MTRARRWKLYSGIGDALAMACLVLAVLYQLWGDSQASLHLLVGVLLFSVFAWRSEYRGDKAEREAK